MKCEVCNKFFDATPSVIVVRFSGGAELRVQTCYHCAKEYMDNLTEKMRKGING